MTDQQKFYNSIGASQCAAVLGLDKNCSPYQLWREFLYPEERPNLDDNEAVLWGKKLQHAIAGEALTRLGFNGTLVRHDPEPSKHPKYDFIRASPDVLICGGQRVVDGTIEIDKGIDLPRAGMEVKNRGLNMAKFYTNPDEVDPEDATDDVLPTEALQAHHSLWVTGLPVWYVAVLIGGQQLRTFTIKRDEAVCERIERACLEFWNCVETLTPPPPINSDDLKLLYPKHVAGKSVEATPEVCEWVEERKKVKESMKAEKIALDTYEFRIKAFMADAEELRSGTRKLVSWKQQGHSHFDIDGFRAEHADLAEAFTLDKPRRVMR